MTKQKIYPWAVCIVGALVLFCNIGLYSTVNSIFQPYIISENSFTHTEASLIVTMRSFVGVITMALTGKYIDKLKTRLAAAVSLVILGLGFFAYSVAGNLYIYFIGSVLIGAGHSFGGMVLISVIVNNWFNSRQATVIAICSAGSGLAATVVPPLITPVIEEKGIGTAYLYITVFVMLIAFLSFVVLRNSPEELNISPYVSKKEDKKKVKTFADEDLTKGQFMLVLIGMFALGCYTTMNSSYAASLYRFCGIPSNVVSSVISVGGVVLIISKLLYGAIVDRAGCRKTNIFYVGLAILASIMISLSGLKNIPHTYASQIILEIAIPLSTVGTSTLAASISKKESYARNLKNMQTVYMTGILVYGFLIGVIADHFGSYVPAEIIAGVLIAIYGILTIGVLFKKNKE